MKEYFQLPLAERQEIIKQIQDILKKREDVVFAYIYGTFVDAPSFKDIDIAVYLDPETIKDNDILEKELTISALLVPGYPVDLRILNNAPLWFQNNVAHSGELLFSKDNKILSQFLEISSLFMLANVSVVRESLAALAAR